MKSLRLICLAGLLAAAFSVRAAAEIAATNINPALLYYQSFLLAPTLEPADQDFLLGTNQWRNQHLPARFGELVARYDSQFKLVRAAAASEVPCDWGIDITQGPTTFLPHLARGKAVAIAARSRAIWDLQQGRPDEASEDLVASLVLGRNLSRDGTLISTLVQIAVEAMTCCTVAENFGRFSPEALQRLVEGIRAAPARGTVAGTQPVEKFSCYHWTVRRIQELRQQYGGDDAKVMAAISKFMGFTLPDVGLTNKWAQIAAAAGGTSDGVLRLLAEQAQFHGKLMALMDLPYAEYEAQARAAAQEIEQSPNLFIRDNLDSFLRARRKELRIEVTLAMVRAAVEYKLHGEQGLQSVADPCGQGSFGFRRFLYYGVDRGFALSSPFDAGGFSQVLIFVEKEGPPFLVDGPRVGQPKQ